MTGPKASEQQAKARIRIRTVVRVVSFGLLGLALARELRKPAEDREWHGQLWVVPYDLRPPTPARLRDALWAPDEPRIFTRRPFGVGWAVNFGRLYHLWQQRRTQAA